jgi:hypothetical protein
VTFLVVVLRALIVLLGLAGLAVPVVAVGFAVGSGAADAAPLYAAAGAGITLCALVALAAVWVLLTRVRRATIFDGRALHWVDAIIVAGIAASLLVVALAVHVVLVVEPPLDAPGLVVVAGGAVLLAASFDLLMVVMRGLLTTAIGLRGELDEVV